MRVCAQASVDTVVCSLLQPDCCRHRSPRCTVSSICRRHAASSHHACQQHTRRAVHYHRVYHWRQTGTNLQNGLQLNLDKSEAVIVGTTSQLHAVMSSMSSVSVAGVDLPVAEVISAGSRHWSAADVSQAHLGSGAIMQLPCRGHLAPADYRNGTDAGV